MVLITTQRDNHFSITIISAEGLGIETKISRFQALQAALKPEVSNLKIKNLSQDCKIKRVRTKCEA